MSTQHAAAAAEPKLPSTAPWPCIIIRSSQVQLPRAMEERGESPGSYTIAPLRYGELYYSSPQVRGANLGAEMLNTVTYRGGAEFPMAMCFLGEKVIARERINRIDIINNQIRRAGHSFTVTK